MWVFTILLALAIFFNPFNARTTISSAMRNGADWIDSIQTTKSSGVEQIVIPNPFYKK